MKTFFHHSDGTLEPVRGQFRLSLSTRESEVCSLVADGLSDKAIAATLSIAASTVKQYVWSARMKLGAHNRTALGVAYTRLVPPPTPPAPVIAFRKAA